MITTTYTHEHGKEKCSRFRIETSHNISGSPRISEWSSGAVQWPRWIGAGQANRGHSRQRQHHVTLTFEHRRSPATNTFTLTTLATPRLPWWANLLYPSSSMASNRGAYFPRSDATVLQSRHAPPEPATRPTAVAPILDVDNAETALNAWSVEVAQAVYPRKDDVWAPASIPSGTCSQECAADRYLFPMLTHNERLRLTMLFYYTWDVFEDQELMSRLQEKVMLAQETAGWEFAIAGLLDHNTYTRMVTFGLPLAVLPRRESTCAHTVNQPPGVRRTNLGD
jgi:hypothetical protein